MSAISSASQVEQTQSLSQTWNEAIRTAARACGVADPPPYDGSDPPLVWASAAGLGEDLVGRAAAIAAKAPFYDEIAGWPVVEGFIDYYPIAHARTHGLIPLVTPDDGPCIVLADPRSETQLDTARRLLGAELGFAYAPAGVIQKAIDEAYGRRSQQAESVLGSIDREEVLGEIDGLAGREDLLDSSGRAPVIKLVNLILFDAVKAGASDIHVQPEPDRVVVRMRIDGVLFDTITVPKNLQEEVLSRLKVQGRMDIAEKRLPQDGRATVCVGERMIDLRIASLPGSNGERVVVRLLDKSARLYTLPEVGMDAADLADFEGLIGVEHGLVLVTGPTGSGKSTTLYAALQAINTTDRNVVTLEDPIEYDISGVSQTQINVKKGLTFATGLRNVLRQDPDIIMVGEIRDHETAVMAIQSALTGHLVFSTLHTNDAASAVTRLLDLGIEPYLVSSSLLGVVAQRLVRRNCDGCSRPSAIPDADLSALGATATQASAAQARRGDGCEQCRNSGYRGRLGLFEVLKIDQRVREAIERRASAAQIRDVAVDAGMRLLRADGAQKVLDGRTTVDEVHRVTVRSVV